MRTPKNHFKAGVRFDSHAYSVENLKDVELTPADVLRELEDFCGRIRRDIAKQDTLADPEAGTDTGVKR
jgi:hypothetical protein